MIKILFSTTAHEFFWGATDFTKILTAVLSSLTAAVQERQLINSKENGIISVFQGTVVT